MDDCIAPPAPIPDNTSDQSIEEKTYLYTFLETYPYWKAFPSKTKTNLLKHDWLEQALNDIRELDFKVREAWRHNKKISKDH